MLSQGVDRAGMKCTWKVSYGENKGHSFCIYEVLCVFWLHASMCFVFSTADFVFFFFFFNTICALNAFSKLFWKTLHIMKQSFEDVSAQ